MPEHYQRPPLQRACLDGRCAAAEMAAQTKWKFEVGTSFAGVGPDPADDELCRIAPDHPALRLTLQ